jgi:hypothetical protein
MHDMSIGGLGVLTCRFASLLQASRAKIPTSTEIALQLDLIASTDECHVEPTTFLCGTHKLIIIAVSKPSMATRQEQ